ncbi:MAG: ATP-dependent zinc metalloprotease FtsH [Acholeplasmatales bacterium]|nr:ATP-dependent zinc metalloprotease FtsH [Acholeplasmatales bacterium]
MNNKTPQRKKVDVGVWVLTILLLFLVVLAFYRLTRVTPKNITSYELAQIVEASKKEDANTKISSIQSQPVNNLQVRITGTIEENDGTNTKSYDFVSLVYADEISEFNKEVSINAIEPKDTTWISILINIVPLVLMVLFFIWIMKSNSNTKAMDFGKSTAHLARGKTVTFKDVAGCEEEKQEMEEIVDFLKNPAKYTQIGARIPKGVLLSGNPGTGKTLLARAVAGEAGVPFFSISGSEFVEMFVGVGASRVRDLFKQAKQNAPCIIFIDEIDAVGRQRGAGMGGGHDEREQTLNQLLVEMDGFATNLGIVVMAATNRPDVLDPALLRPGRFDRQITISLPDVKGREAILKVHARNKKFDKDVNFEDIAHRLPGFSGAEIENLLNEAALLAARANRTTINKFDIDEATDRVMMGPAKKSHRMTDKERNRVAHHEAGHAVIGLKLEHSNVVQKVTIIPRGQAGGYALMLPEEETYLSTKRDLLDRITGFLGGRVAEEICFGEVSTGASNDFENATKIARAMVTEYGMSDLGPVTYEQPQGSVFLGRDYLKDKNFSDQVALEIDREQRRIIEECYADAKTCLTENKELLERIAYYLIEIETLTKQDIDEINATGNLKWYDDQKAAKEAAKNVTSTVEETTITESTTANDTVETPSTSETQEEKDAE